MFGKSIAARPSADQQDGLKRLQRKGERGGEWAGESDLHGSIGVDAAGLFYVLHLRRVNVLHLLDSLGLWKRTEQQQQNKTKTKKEGKLLGTKVSKASTQGEKTHNTSK